MPYRLTSHRSLGQQLSDILGKELDTALESLAGDTPDAEAIHDARRSVKRARAVVRLVEAELGAPSEEITLRLRSAAHVLAAMREADANLETLDQLQVAYGSLVTSTVARAVRRGLETREHASRANAGEALETARRSLEQVKASAPAQVKQVAHLRVVRAGALRAYRRPRRVLAGLSRDSGDAEFHLWRRRLKDHYYHMRLLEGIHTTPRTRARALNLLEECLGDDHNLGILADLILAAPERYGTARDTALVLGCIAQEQRRLRIRALDQGWRSFSWRPSEFDRLLRGWWRDSAQLKPD
jgi:CHAD domain-containing protein